MFPNLPIWLDVIVSSICIAGMAILAMAVLILGVLAATFVGCIPMIIVTMVREGRQFRRMQKNIREGYLR